MTARIRYLLYLVRSSFWFLPAVMLLAGVALSWMAVQVDLAAPEFMKRAFTERNILIGPSGGRAMLTTIAGSMITVASLVFSMTLIVLTMAAGQLGPRILSRFMRDRVTQISLGLFLATFVYCVAVLLTVEETPETNFVPQFSILMGVVLSIASFAWLILYIHTVAVSIQSDTVIARIAGELDHAIVTILEAIEEEEDPDEEDGAQAKEEMPDEDRHVVTARRDGYVQLIEYGDVVALAGAHDIEICFETRPGLYVLRGEIIAEAWPRDRVPDDLDDRVRRACVIDDRRTFAQDLEFAFTALVEIGVRALSPGINDFNTAVSVVDRLASSLSAAFRCGLPAPTIEDAEGNTRIYLSPITYGGLVDTAFNELRQCAMSSVPVYIRLIEALIRLVPRARTRSQLEALEKHAGIMKRCVDRLACDDADKEDIAERLDRLDAALEKRRR